MSDYLNVYKDSEIVGTLRESNGGLVFTYNKAWLERPGAVPLAEYIPLQAESISGENVESFFGNFLPEGDILKFLSKAWHISPDNLYGWLERIAGDVAGSFYILQKGSKPGEDRYEQIAEDAIRDWVGEMDFKPLILNAKGARISLSGAQDKISLMIKDNEFFLPIGAAPSTHILKPRIVDDRRHIKHSAVNEAFIMMLGEAVGIGVADVEYRKELMSTIVKRYDRRIIKNGRVERIHQLDFCQMLNIPSEKKYESEGGPQIKECFKVVEAHASAPARDAKRLIELLAFNAVVGNMDGHAKNLSMVFDGGKTELAPFYDLLCTSIYQNLSQRLAFKIGGENRPRFLMKRHWEKLAVELAMRLEYITKTVSVLVEMTESKVEDVAGRITPLIDSDEKLFIEDVAGVIRSNAKRLLQNMSGGGNNQAAPS